MSEPDDRVVEFTGEEVSRILACAALDRLGLQEADKALIKMGIDTATQKPVIFTVTLRGVK